MTKLYHGPEGFGWQIPGKQERAAARVDVPNSPEELAEWLNVRWVQRDAHDPTLSEVLDLERAKQREDDLQLSGRPTEGRFWEVGPPTKDPPRLSPAFLGDLASGAEFVPVTKAAEIDRLLQRCPKCHGGELGHFLHWLAAAPAADLERARTLIDENLADRLNDDERID
jgi:hypothetical protein